MTAKRKLNITPEQFAEAIEQANQLRAQADELVGNAMELQRMDRETDLAEQEAANYADSHNVDDGKTKE